MIRRIFIYTLFMAVACPVALSFAGERVFYYHTDQSGTPIAMTDESGSVVWRADYKPFGEEQSINPAAVENNEKFVGKEKDKETGMYYFGARYMQDKIGRFVSPDPVGPIDPMTGEKNQKILMNPQMLNLYAYAAHSTQFCHLIRFITATSSGQYAIRSDLLLPPLPA